MKSLTGRALSLGHIVALVCLCGMIGCDAVPLDQLPDGLDDLIDGNEDPNAADEIELFSSVEVMARNTDGASGIAVRPSDGALFYVNATGVYGPVSTGFDGSTATPLGAGNLADATIFDLNTESFVLAIANSGDFWIGSQCCGTLAVVPAAGGDAEQYLGLLEGGVDALNIKPETFALAPEGFNGPQMRPGDLLVGQETTFSRLAAIDVDRDRSAVAVDNPAVIADPDDGLNREAHHLAFGPDGVLYSSKRTVVIGETGIQTISADGTPNPLERTEDLAANSFVVLENGDLVIRGVYDPAGPTSLAGLLHWSSETGEVRSIAGVSLDEISGDDELKLSADGRTIYLALPAANEILALRLINGD